MAAKFAGKVAVVTGASSGIGLEVAAALAAQGAKVLMVSRSEDKLRNALASIPPRKAHGGELSFFVGDVGKEKTNEEMLEFTNETFGSPADIVVLNAGIYTSLVIEETEEEQFDAIMNTNVKSVLFGLKHAIKEMKKAGKGGSIVINSSVMGIKSTARFPGAGVYSATKASVNKLAEYAQIEAAQYKIRVNTVCPGHIYTPIYRSDPAAMEEFGAKQHLIPRMGTAEETSNVILFLVSDEASFVWGNVMPVDGGWLLK